MRKKLFGSNFHKLTNSGTKQQNSIKAKAGRLRQPAENRSNITKPAGLITVIKMIVGRRNGQVGVSRRIKGT